VPSLLIAAKDDLDPNPVAIQDSVKVFVFSLATLSSHSQLRVYMIFNCACEFGIALALIYLLHKKMY
jgi:hypothetical protein